MPPAARSSAATSVYRRAAQTWESRRAPKPLSFSGWTGGFVLQAIGWNSDAPACRPAPRDNRPQLRAHVGRYLPGFALHRGGATAQCLPSRHLHGEVKGLPAGYQQGLQASQLHLINRGFITGWRYVRRAEISGRIATQALNYNEIRGAGRYLEIQSRQVQYAQIARGVIVQCLP